MSIVETIFSVGVLDMPRATAFYERALGATLIFASPGWTSIRIAGVRLGLVSIPDHASSKTGLHFAVGDLAAVVADVGRAGGRLVMAATEIAPGVVIVEVADIEGNSLTLIQR